MRWIIAVASWILVLAVAGVAGAVEMDPENDEWLDSYEDEDGNLWDVFMSADGFMYDAKLVETKAGYEYGTDGGDRTVHLAPYRFWYRKGMWAFWFYEEDFEYKGSTCGYSYCRVWSISIGATYPQDVDEIWGKARTVDEADYCDGDYDGDWYNWEDAQWLPAQTRYCEDDDDPDYIAYYVGEDDHEDMENYDYGAPPKNRIIRWLYRASDGYMWEVRLVWVVDPEEK